MSLQQMPTATKLATYSILDLRPQTIYHPETSDGHQLRYSKSSLTTISLSIT